MCVVTVFTKESNFRLSGIIAIKRELLARLVRKTLRDIKPVLHVFRIITDNNNVVFVHEYFDVIRTDRDASTCGADLFRHFVDKHGI